MGSNIGMTNDENRNPRNINYEYVRLTGQDIKNHAMVFIGK